MKSDEIYSLIALCFSAYTFYSVRRRNQRIANLYKSGIDSGGRVIYPNNNVDDLTIAELDLRTRYLFDRLRSVDDGQLGIERALRDRGLQPIAIARNTPNSVNKLFGDTI